MSHRKTDIPLKSIVILVSFVILLVSCQRKNSVQKYNLSEQYSTVMTGFGKAKTGMTVEEFEDTFNKKLILTPASFIGNYDSRVDSLMVGETILLSSVYLQFKGKHLCYIGTNKNPLLFNYLKRHFGIEEHNESGNGFSGTFKTNIDSIVCAYEYYNGGSNIGIFAVGSYK